MEKIQNPKTQETTDPTALTALCSTTGSTLKLPENSTLLVEISPNKFLYINPNLDEQQKADLIKLLQK